jgi:hypothetical protein
VTAQPCGCLPEPLTLADRIAAARAVPGNLGDGWMSRNARDMVVIAAFAGFDRAEAVRRVALRSNPSRTTNAATVERVLDEMHTEWVDAHEVAR